MPLGKHGSYHHADADRPKLADDFKSVELKQVRVDQHHVEHFRILPDRFKVGPEMGVNADRLYQAARFQVGQTSERFVVEQIPLETVKLENIDMPALQVFDGFKT